MFLTNIVLASWEDVYQNIQNTYIGKVEIEDLASAALKGLNTIDKDLNIGNGAKSISLYYKGRVIDSVSKPEDGDVVKWGEITRRFVDKAIEKSKKVAEKDFEVFDAMARAIPDVLDDDSKFFENIDEARGIVVRNKRMFAKRVMDNVLIVKIVSFNKQTVAELNKTIEEYQMAEAIVFDLRGCLGGMSSEAIKAADLFLDNGIITSMKGKDQFEEVYYTSKEDNIWKNKPVFIFVDGNTASAGEIFVAALKDQGIATVIGTLTKGKGSMQKLIPLETGSVLAVTDSFFKTPANNEIHYKGIIPDICTFELSDNQNIENLLNRKFDDCYRENREEALLEYKIVLKLLKKDS
jgi:hypothetical protein